jgi:hypothetical protein
MFFSSQRRASQPPLALHLHGRRATNSTQTSRGCNFKTHLAKECNGDRSAVAHAFSLHDIASRFADITPLAEAEQYIGGLDAGSRSGKVD